MCAAKQHTQQQQKQWQQQLTHQSLLACHSAALWPTPGCCTNLLRVLHPLLLPALQACSEGDRYSRVFDYFELPPLLLLKVG